MKDGWEVRPLGEVAEVGAGNPAPQGKQHFDGGTVPFIRTADVGQVRFGEIAEAEDAVVEATGKTLRLVPEGTILLPKSGASTFLNHRVITTRDAYVASHLATVTPDPQISDRRYLLYALSLVRAQDLLPENAYPSLNLKQVKGIPVPLPPLEEQRWIVAVLDEAFEGLARARANIEANLADAEELRTRAIAAVFEGLEEASPSLLLKDVALDFGRGKSKHRPRNDPRLYGGEYPFVQTGDVRAADRYLRAHSQSYNETGLAQSKLWPEGTVCVTIAANIAETAMLTYSACFPDSVIGIVPKDDAAIAEYIEYVLQYARVRLQARGRGAAQDNINLKTFETEYFPFPSVPHQESAVRQLDEVHDRIGQFVKEGYEQLADLDALRQALLARAFRGELT